jgi:hypothetical protein
LVTVLVVLGVPTKEALGAVASGPPFFARTELFWPLETRVHGFLVVEVVWGEEVASGEGGDSFSSSGMTEVLLSPAMGTLGIRGRSVRAGWVSILRRCSVWAACCLRSWCLLISCFSSLKKPEREGWWMDPGA